MSRSPEIDCNHDGAYCNRCPDCESITCDYCSESGFKNMNGLKIHACMMHKEEMSKMSEATEVTQAREAWFNDLDNDAQFKKGLMTEFVWHYKPAFMDYVSVHFPESIHTGEDDVINVRWIIARKFPLVELFALDSPKLWIPFTVTEFERRHLR